MKGTGDPHRLSFSNRLQEVALTGQVGHKPLSPCGGRRELDSIPWSIINKSESDIVALGIVTTILLHDIQFGTKGALIIGITERMYAVKEHNETPVPRKE